MTATLLVGLGGALGSIARYWFAVLAEPISTRLPMGTMLINIAGSFAIGLFGAATVASGRYPLSDDARLFVMVGVCGGFTTFSSFSLQTLDLLRQGAPARALANVVVSVAVCLAAVACGYAIGAGLGGNPRLAGTPGTP